MSYISGSYTPTGALSTDLLLASNRGRHSPALHRRDHPALPLELLTTGFRPGRDRPRLPTELDKDNAVSTDAASIRGAVNSDPIRTSPLPSPDSCEGGSLRQRDRSPTSPAPAARSAT